MSAPHACTKVVYDGPMPARPRRKRAKKPNLSVHPLKRPASKAEASAIERLRAICFALPEVTEKIAWGEPTWRAGKLFAQMDRIRFGGPRLVRSRKIRPRRSGRMP